MATFTPDSYTRARAAQDQATTQVAQIAVRVENAVAVLQALETELTQLGQAAPNGWAGLASYVSAEAVANPTDEDWASLDSQVGKLVADFQAKKTEVEAINAAIAAV